MSYENNKQSYISKFLSLKCSGDVLNIVNPINNAEKEISESMAIIKRLKSIILERPRYYNIIDLCAGNALTSIIAIHLLPITTAIAVDKLPRDRNWGAVHRFSYLYQNIHETLTESLINDRTILISSHPCKNARRVVELYRSTPAAAMILIPCCEGSLKNKYPQLIHEKLGHYLTWCYDLAIDCGGNMIVDSKILSPKNCVIVDRKDNHERK